LCGVRDRAMVILPHAVGETPAFLSRAFRSSILNRHLIQKRGSYLPWERGRRPLPSREVRESCEQVDFCSQMHVRNEFSLLPLGHWRVRNPQESLWWLWVMWRKSLELFW